MIRFRIQALIFLTGLLAAFQLHSQTGLKPSIGIGALPSDNAALCNAPWYLGNFTQSGLQEGDSAADFTLYELNGTAFNLQAALQTGKPVLLVAGSYTCPVFRGKIAVINDIVANYGTDITTVVVYELEAHPDVDTSVYFGYVNPGSQNLNSGILYRQPTTYGGRKAIAQGMLDSLPINAIVVMDGPCDEFWMHYGPAPNNAYLIDTSGIVVAKHAWFDKYPEDIYCDLDSLLGNSTNCGSTGNGTFSWQLDGSNIVTGPAGLTLAAHGWLINNSASDALILMVKNQQILPAGWASSICTDVCYPSTSDSANLLLPAGDSLWYTQYFYTDQIPDTGRVQMFFRNENVPSNGFVQWFGGITTLSTSLPPLPDEPILSLWPQPSSGAVNLRLRSDLSGPGQVLWVYNLQGQLQLRQSIPDNGLLRLEAGSLPSGISFYRIMEDGVLLTQGKTAMTNN
jgi:hypothetical protein